MMHTFRKTPREGLLPATPDSWTVGFYGENIGWHPLKEVVNAELAMAWVSYLNGGPHPSQVGWLGEE